MEATGLKVGPDNPNMYSVYLAQQAELLRAERTTWDLQKNLTEMRLLKHQKQQEYREQVKLHDHLRKTQQTLTLELSNPVPPIKGDRLFISWAAHFLLYCTFFMMLLYRFMSTTTNF
jgi:hypothetical protein